MSTIVDKIKLDAEHDRRVKLLQEDKQKINDLYSTGNYSLNELAKMYKVSKKSILLITNEDSKKKDIQRNKENWKKYQGTKEERTIATKKTREYKRKLLQEGKIFINDCK